MTQLHLLPAIMVGGPPHSGKSVLIYNLTQQLRALEVDHYVVRACPDGEGDWSYEADAPTVRQIRVKGTFTANFVEQVVNALENRLLPLLVDVGGRPQPDQEAILAACSHAILIAADEGQLATWRALADRLAIPVIAELISSLTDADDVVAVNPFLRARIYGLERGATVVGPTMDQLLGLVRALFVVKEAVLRGYHLAQAPVEMSVDLERVARELRTTPPGRWQPTDLPRLLAYLPTDEPLAIYGRAPNWVYATLAAATATVDFYQFDARLGWVRPPLLTVGALPAESFPESPTVLTSVTAPETESVYTDLLYTDGTLHYTIRAGAQATLLHVKSRDPYLDYSQSQTLRLPTISPTQPLVLSGRLPFWLITAMVRAYWMREWLGIYYPALNGAVIIYQQPSKESSDQIGRVIPFSL